MLRYTDTTVFNVGAQTIVNTVNCIGVMGAGLALEFQLRFPEMEKNYVERCKQRRVEVGRPYLYKEYVNPWILNFPTKNHWKYPSKIEWIEQGLKYFSANYQRGGITSIAFPKLGCSNGGLEWNTVAPLMEKYLQDLDIDVFICKDTEKEASGTEGIMVQMLNDIETLSWPEELGIRADIKRKIISALPIGRFRDLRKVEGIGKQTYNDVFSFLYQLAKCDGDTDDKQKLGALNFNLLEESNSSLSRNVELVISSPQTTKSEEIKDFSNGLNLESEYLFENRKPESQLDNLEDADAFHILLPHIEKSLNVGKTRDEIANRFKLPKKLIGDWLQKAEKLGKIKKISSRPVKYIATSSMHSEQLECSFTS
jgi:O-acetyl-ADP-ribose deacetylase (regulator of RNase III)